MPGGGGETSRVILAWAGAACLLGACALTARWLMRRYDALGRKRSFPFMSVSILIALAIALFFPFVRRLQLEARLEDAASVVAGVDVEVHCQSFGEAFVDAGVELGFVRFGPDGVPEHSTLIKREQCGFLRDYISSDHVDPPIEHVVAVHTLTHEAVHMSGVTSESETECLAMQQDAEIAELLGASADEAATLADHYRREVYPRMPDGYRSPDCPAGSG